MTQASAKDTFSQLCAKGETSGPVPMVAVDRAQNELGVIFPDEYRDFLATYGAAIILGTEVYGLPNQEKNIPPLWNDVVTVTKSLRAKNQIGANDVSYIPVSEDGLGSFIYLNTGASPLTELWNVGPGVSEIVSTNFYEFFCQKG